MSDNLDSSLLSILVLTGVFPALLIVVTTTITATARLACGLGSVWRTWVAGLSLVLLLAALEAGILMFFLGTPNIHGRIAESPVYIVPATAAALAVPPVVILLGAGGLAAAGSLESVAEWAPKTECWPATGWQLRSDP